MKKPSSNRLSRLYLIRPPEELKNPGSSRLLTEESGLYVIKPPEETRLYVIKPPEELRLYVIKPPEELRL